MNTERGNDRAGFGPPGRSRADELGVWSAAVTPDGRAGSTLRFDPRRTADPAVRDRLIAAVIADRRLAHDGLTGLLPVADLVTAHGEIWLLTAEPVSPTLADLLAAPPGAPRPGAGEAATVLLETARTLLAVHAAGLSHGALRPRNVTIAADGSVLLTARGLADALEGRPSLPERDVTAWARLAGELAASWAGSPQGAELFERAAAAATAHGLAQGRDVLITGGASPARSGLTEAARWASGHAVPPSPAPPQSPSPSLSPATPDEGEAVTLLHLPTADPAPPRGGESGGEKVVRFGPGVPTETTAAQIWRAGREQQQNASPSGRPSSPRAPAVRRRRRTALASAIVALTAVGVLLVWLLRTPTAPLAVTGVKVSAPKRTQGCDATVTITGTLLTNGSAGEIRYQWRRSDRKAPIEQTDTVPSGEISHKVSLEWTVKGEGDFKGTATLRVLSPLPEGGKLQDKGGFVYRCP